jgi:hypothetical protein
MTRRIGTDVKSSPGDDSTIRDLITHAASILDVPHTPVEEIWVRSQFVPAKARDRIRNLVVRSIASRSNPYRVLRCRLRTVRR